ncbi:MAG TPA: site-specific integrase [Terriglobia bacterium]|nr:site-specific integrase [Terriglobia bacterium]
MSELRQRMIDQMTLRGFSPRTHESYLEAVTGLARYYKQSPDQLSSEQVRQYLLYLERERHLAWSSLNVAASGLRFLYFDTLKWEPVKLEIPPRTTPRRLPEVLSRGEVDRLISSVLNLKHRTLLMTIYAAGLRVGEAVSLQVGDIDSARMTIRVVQGKGRKDRYTILSPRLLEGLRQYWKQYRPKQYLFEGIDPQQHIHESVAQKVYNRAKQQTGIHKGIGVHTLRHCFATHLLEAGVDLRTIQTFLGHNAISTTMLYLQVRQQHIAAHAEKFDLLALPPKPTDV